MSQEQPMQSHALSARRQIPIRFDQLKRIPVGSVIGLSELVGLSAAALLVLLTVFAYFYFFLPSHSRLRAAEQERESLQGMMRASQKNFDQNITTHEAVDKISNSLDDFEERRLASLDTGRMALYAELNNLIRANAVRNTAGPTYTTLEPIGTKTQVQPTASAEKQSNAKWQTIYPGIAVSVTVEGPYSNVWHFVRDIETSKLFLIINAVELEGISHSGQTQAEEPVSPVGNGRKPLPALAAKSDGRGTLVSLRLDLATYFRRSNASSP